MTNKMAEDTIAAIATESVGRDSDAGTASRTRPYLNRTAVVGVEGNRVPHDYAVDVDRWRIVLRRRGCR